jgi:hypothetical protein
MGKNSWEEKFPFPFKNWPLDGVALQTFFLNYSSMICIRNSFIQGIKNGVLNFDLLIL